MPAAIARRSLRVVLIAGALLARPAALLHAWGPTGHRVVARIAWMNMTPAARAKAIAILSAATPATKIRQLRPTHGTAADADATFFAQAATWPDIVKSDASLSQFDHRGWHFADHFWHLVGGQPRLDSSRGPDAQNEVERLTRFTGDFRSNNAANAENAIQLVWMLHLLGDLHQPLHNESRETSSQPQGDRGGNAFALDGRHELHGYWDGILDEVATKDAASLGSAFPTGASFDSPEYINAWASLITSRHPKASVAADTSIDEFETWSDDGLAIAEQNAYAGVQQDAAPSATYRHKVDQISELAIAHAGYRLATLLNSLLG
jgi:hypothetical protein